MSFNDIFKSSFLESVSSFSITDVLLGMIFSVAIGLFIFLIYKKTFTGVMYSTSFSVTLVGLSLVTTLVIMAVTSNVVLSLGMVGALSIVRFRTAIKEPMEIVFLFWAIASGIVIGAGMIPLSIIGSAIIGIVLLIFANKKVSEDPYIIVISCTDDGSEQSALNMIEKSVQRYVVKTKTVTSTGIEITAEIRIKDSYTGFVNKICNLDGVQNATLVSYNGEYMS